MHCTVPNTAVKSFSTIYLATSMFVNSFQTSKDTRLVMDLICEFGYKVIRTYEGFSKSGTPLKNLDKTGTPLAPLLKNRNSPTQPYHSFEQKTYHLKSTSIVAI